MGAITTVSYAKQSALLFCLSSICSADSVLGFLGVVKLRRRDKKQLYTDASCVWLMLSMTMSQLAG